MKTGCIIQARVTSTRLPGKVLKYIDFENRISILQSIIERVKQSKNVDTIIIATTINEQDNEIALVAKNNQVGCYRGSEFDVLDRYYQAATTFHLDRIVRITSDCPFIDPAVIDNLVDVFNDGSYDYVSNCLPRTYPHGLDCEVFSFSALSSAWKAAKQKSEREHVTAFIYNHPKLYKIGSLALENEDYSNVRITVDTKSDYALSCVIYSILSGKANQTSFRTILELFEEHPYLTLINEDVSQKKQYATKEEEFDEAIRVLKLQELNRAAQLLEEKRSEL